MTQNNAIKFPRQSACPVKPRSEKIAFICFYEPKGISTVPEIVAFIQQYSKFSIIVLNLYEHRMNSDALNLNCALDLNAFDGIIVHNTVAYSIHNLRTLDHFLKIKIKDYRGIKVLMKQDENLHCMEMAEYIGQSKYDLVLTCLPEEAISKVYPERLAGQPKFLRMLTGYVTPTLRSFRSEHLSRTIDIGYRGSIQPLSFGQLAFEKRKIGDDIAELLSNTTLKLNISSRWEDRFGGMAWLNFLASCRATLGVESGGSVFDLDGNLEKIIEDIENKLQSLRDDASYERLYLTELEHLENQIYYNQISPRHFEAAATKTLQIMYPGAYSDIFKPNQHYVELQRDYSNLDDVLSILQDENRCLEIVERAYEEIIMSPKYGIETFAQTLDEHLEQILQEKQIKAKFLFHSPEDTRNILFLGSFDSCSKDSTLPTFSGLFTQSMDTEDNSLASDYRLVQIVCDLMSNQSTISVQSSVEIFSLKHAGRTQFDSSVLMQANESVVGSVAISVLWELEHLLTLQELEFCERLGAPVTTHHENFRSLINYDLKMSALYLKEAIQVRGLHIVIATDLSTLIVGLILKSLFNVQVVYYEKPSVLKQDIKRLEYERDFLSRIGAKLLLYADQRLGLSSSLAKELSSFYGLQFDKVQHPLLLNALTNSQLQPLKILAQHNSSMMYQPINAPQPINFVKKVRRLTRYVPESLKKQVRRVTTFCFKNY